MVMALGEEAENLEKVLEHWAELESIGEGGIREGDILKPMKKVILFCTIIFAWVGMRMKRER